MTGDQKLLDGKEFVLRPGSIRIRSAVVALGLTSLFSASSLGQQESTTLIRPRPNPFRSAIPTNETPSIRGQREGADAGTVIHLEKLPNHQERPVITALSVSSDGNTLAAAGDDHAIRIVDLATGRTKHTLLGHGDWVQCVEYSPGGDLLASCGNDGQLRVWRIQDQPILLDQKSVDHALLNLCFVGDDMLFIAGFGSNIYRWTSADSSLTVDHKCECRDIRSIAVSPNHQLLAYGGRDGVLRIRPIDRPKLGSASDRSVALVHQPHDPQEVAVPLHFDRIRSLQFSEDGTIITSVGEDRRIVHYSLLERKASGKTEIGGGKLMGLCQLEPHLFALAGSDNSIRIFNDLDRNVLVKLIGHDGSVGVLKRNARYLISGSFDTTIRIWDVEKALANSDGQGKYVHPIAAQFEDSGAGDTVK